MKLQVHISPRMLEVQEGIPIPVKRLQGHLQWCTLGKRDLGPSFLGSQDLVSIGLGLPAAWGWLGRTRRPLNLSTIVGASKEGLGVHFPRVPGLVSSVLGLPAAGDRLKRTRREKKKD